ncbi:hypothetical protein [Butyrivibrio sp. AE2032]|uniref:hypothetical protein n=1 Tax=Butyrivibrio sp. AE2032 TaxID=1458463 RepID=UPI00082F480F|nr:hypothetical protein [Butyrivibrio sp. AE2032]
MVFAVDFDGTLSFGEWPEVGPANHNLIEYLKDRKHSGDKLILWTCRAGDALDAAVDWCSGNGLEFDAINDNLPEVTEKYGNNSRKISCDVYIDDRAVNAGDYRKVVHVGTEAFDYELVERKLIGFAESLVRCS